MSKNPQGRSKQSGRKRERPKLKRRRKPATEKRATAREAFQKAHEDGMEALKKHDFDTLGDAIKRERNIIEDQNKTLETSIRKQKVLLASIRKQKSTP